MFSFALDELRNAVEMMDHEVDLVRRDHHRFRRSEKFEFLLGLEGFDFLRQKKNVEIKTGFDLRSRIMRVVVFASGPFVLKLLKTFRSVLDATATRKNTMTVLRVMRETRVSAFTN